MDDIIKTTCYQTVAGELIIGSYKGRLCLCDWNTETRRRAIDSRLSRRLKAAIVSGTSSVIIQTIAELNEYFAGERKVFTVPTVFSGSEFQCKVWHELTKIAYGETISYGELARRIDKPTAARAVASAVGANPMSIIVPCHRVIGSGHKLTGYAGGLDAKRILLGIEGHLFTRGIFAEDAYEPQEQTGAYD